ncbi:MAG: PA domain-containing protein [Schleiferiaceae bacterium]
MNKILLLFGALALTVGVQAQVVLNIMSPSSLQGGITHTNNGAVAGWGLADLLDPADAVLDTVVVMDDSTAGINTVVGTDPNTGNAYPGIPLKYEGCNLDTNSAWQTGRLAGKIVLIARGTCEFGKKVYLAEKAGARAVIMYNRDNAGLNAAPGVYGGLATIPFAMIARPDGDNLLNAILAGQTVVAFLGNKIGAFPNDLSVSPAEALYPPALAVPGMLAMDSTDFKMKLGFWGRNDGSANQSSVVASVTVKRGGTTVYSMSTQGFPMNSGDSSYISFPPFQLNGYPLGAYEVNYNLTAGTDDFPLDNNIDFATVINDSLYSYARVDAATLDALDNNSYQSSSFTSSWGMCINFQHPNASRMLLKGVRWAAWSNTDTILGRTVDVSVDGWYDSFTDLNDPNCAVTNTSPLALDTYTYTTNAQDQMVSHYFTQPIELDDNQRYIVCINSSDQTLYLNHSGVVAYQLNDQTPGEQPRELVRSDNSWFVRGFSGNVIPTMQLILEQNTSGVDEEVYYDVKPYPNPAQHMVTVDLGGFDARSLDVVDLTGALVLHQDQVSVVDGKLTVDVTNLPNGMYVFTAKGADRDLKFNVVVSH